MCLPRIKVDLLASGRYHGRLLVEGRLLAPIEGDSLVGGGELVGLVARRLIKRLLALNLDGATVRAYLALLAFFTSCLHFASKKTFLQVRTNSRVFRNLKQEEGQPMGSRPNKNRLTYSDCLNE